MKKIYFLPLEERIISRLQPSAVRTFLEGAALGLLMGTAFACVFLGVLGAGFFTSFLGLRLKNLEIIKAYLRLSSHLG